MDDLRHLMIAETGLHNTSRSARRPAISDISVDATGPGAGLGFHSYIDRWLIGEGWISLPA